MKTSTWLMIVAVVVLAVIPLFVHTRHGGQELFGGADGRAQALIGEINPGYKTWFSPLFEPPSTEIATLLFSLQAALGAGVIGFYFGRARGRREALRKAAQDSCT